MISVLRALVSNILFYINTIVVMVIGAPFLLLPRRYIWKVVKVWAWTSMWLTKFIAGIDFEIRGKENLPEGGYLVAAKHQSVWETFALFTLFADPAFILKRELTFIPLFGWYVARTDSIPVERGKRSVAIKNMGERARQEIERGRQIIIFPEGTRRTPGAPPEYKRGSAHLYEMLKAPCVPIALNTGLFWPRRQMRRYPGKVVIEILPPIPAGLTIRAFRKALEDSIETASDRLIEEALAAPNPPPTPEGWPRPDNSDQPGEKTQPQA